MGQGFIFRPFWVELIVIYSTSNNNNNKIFRTITQYVVRLTDKTVIKLFNKKVMVICSPSLHYIQSQERVELTLSLYGLSYAWQDIS